MKKPYNIELSTERNQPVETNIKLCQGDNNITFNINISDFDLTGNTVKIVFTQSNGISVENSAIVNSDNKSCTYNIVGNELQSVGKVVADLKIYDSNNKRLSSACFIFYVELDSLSDGSFPPKSYSASLEKALEECKEATQAALDAIQKVVNIANNDAVTVEGFAWDARRGKAIRDDFNALNESLANCTRLVKHEFRSTGTQEIYISGLKNNRKYQVYIYEYAAADDFTGLCQCFGHTNHNGNTGGKYAKVFSNLQNDIAHIGMQVDGALQINFTNGNYYADIYVYEM